MKRRTWIGWLFALPAALHLVVFALLPILVAVGISFTKWNLIKGNPRFVGGQNFQRIFGDGDFLNALKNTALYALLSVPLGTIAALAVALLVVQKVKGLALFRTLFYLQSVCNQVAIAMIWIYIFLPKTGMINSILGGKEIDYLNTPNLALLALVFMSIWTGLGPRMVLFMSGILNIPDTLYEAAELDGAGSAQRFWRITLPLLAPTSLFVVVTSTIGAMQVFTPVYMMTKGGPDGTTDVVGYHIYSAAWERFQMGEASAMSVVLFALIFAISALLYRAMNRQVEGMS